MDTKLLPTVLQERVDQIDAQIVALRAKLYDADDADNRTLTASVELDDLREVRAELTGEPFDNTRELFRASRQTEKSIVTNAPRRKPPTAKQVLEQQKADAERDHKEPSRAVARTDNSTVLPIPADDGWQDCADEAAERLLQGQLLRFADWKWTTGRDGAEVAAGTRLVATAIAAAWVRWAKGKPSEARVRAPGGRMPAREELGDTDEDEWEEGPDGQPKDPWANTRYVQMFDPQTAEAYTFSTPSSGGREAVSNLADAVARMRSVHPGAVPLVELGAAPMPTRFGRKSKPVLKIVGWRSHGGNGELRELAPPTPSQELRDENRF